MTLLITPTISAVTSNPFSPFEDNTTGLKCSLLQGSESLTLQVYDAGINGAVSAGNPNDVGWTDVIINSVPYTCSSANNLISFALDVNQYRVKKSITTNFVGVSFIQAIPIPIAPKP